MTEASQLLLQHFKEKKAEKDSLSVQEARRLVNLYRSLASFGDDFISQYNQMLLAVKPNVKRLLSTFMGGKEVEDYLEFLEQNAHLTKAEAEQSDSISVSQMKGYLPSPDADLETEVAARRERAAMITISETEWQEMKTQKEILLQQKQDLLKKLNQLGQKPVSATHTASSENYSEIIEDTSGETPNE